MSSKHKEMYVLLKLVASQRKNPSNRQIRHFEPQRRQTNQLRQIYAGLRLNVDLTRNIFVIIRPFLYFHTSLCMSNIQTVSLLVWDPCGGITHVVFQLRVQTWDVCFTTYHNIVLAVFTGEPQACQ